MVLLAKQQKGSAPWPQATIGTISFLISLFLWPLVDPSHACLTVDTAKGWWLLLLAPVHHENPWHLACNVVGVWLSGRRLEQCVGTSMFLVLMASAALFTGFLHLALNLAMEWTFHESHYRAACALGFSGDVQLPELPCGRPIVVPGRIVGGQLLHPEEKVHIRLTSTALTSENIPGARSATAQD
ncbi:rhomboid-related protein 4-like isoform X3 [Notamacropus eugenii]|uniref:rhomboid-related protein 4-like isoform X3 n=1 Tax=Notamacropus eugenii TaxID=9315 RepID=UPI003B6701A0